MNSWLPVHSARGQWLGWGLLGWVSGCALQLGQSALWPLAVYLACTVVAGALLLRLRQGSGVPIAVWVFVLSAALALGWTGSRAVWQAQKALNPALEGKDIDLVGVVSAMPQSSETGLRLRFSVESARLQGEPVSLPGTVMLSWYNGLGVRDDLGNVLAELQQQPDTLRAGERWRWTVRLKAPHGARNPHGFDFELWLWDQGIGATGTVRAGRNDPAPQRIEQTWQHPLEWVRQRVRDAIFEQIADRHQAGIVAGLVVGDQGAIDRSDWDVFRTTGVAHLMSISGLHITMFSWVAVYAIGILWRLSGRLCLYWPAPSASAFGGLLLALAYALFSGWGVPAQRTLLMLACVHLLRLSGRRWPWPMVWLVTMAMISVFDPWALLQAGFWLSFCAVGVLFATDTGSQWLEGRGWRARLRAAWREQWTITVALAPLSLLLFQQFSVVGLVANAVAIPWVTLVVTPLALGGTLWSPLWGLAAAASGWLRVVLQWMAELPLASIGLAAAPALLAAMAVLGGIVLAMPWPFRLRALGLPLVLPVLLWQTSRPELGQFELLAADIGQGNAVLVRTARHTLIYDTGPRYSQESDAGHRVLVPLLRSMGEDVQRVVLSHSDTDHSGGAQAVLQMQGHADLVSSIARDHPLQGQRTATRCLAGSSWEWDGVRFSFLHPSQLDYDAVRKSNAMSCVLRLDNGRQRALLVGDIEKAQEQALTAKPELLRADVLLVPHHGSKTSSSSSFLDAVHPRVALLQAGYRNRFGHPANSVMQRYRERGIAVADTPHCGAALWRSTSPEMVQCERELESHYWQHRVLPAIALTESP